MFHDVSTIPGKFVQRLGCLPSFTSPLPRQKHRPQATTLSALEAQFPVLARPSAAASGYGMSKPKLQQAGRCGQALDALGWSKTAGKSHQTVDNHQKHGDLMEISSSNWG